MPAIAGSPHLIRTYLGPQWIRALTLFALMLAAVGLQLTSPQLIRRFIDEATAGAAINTLLGIGATFLGVALLTQLALVGEQYLAGNVAWTATNSLRADLTLHCLRLDMAYHGAHPPGELVERVDGDVAKLSEFFSRFLVSLLGNMVLLVGILVLSFAIEWRVGAALTSFAIVALAVLSVLRNIGAKPWEAQSRASAGLFGFFEEYLSGTEDLRANGANAFALRRLAEEQRKFWQTTLRAVLRGGIPFSTTSLLLSIGTALGLLTAAYLFRAGVISLGSVYLIFAYTELLRRPLEEIGRQMQQLHQASASVARVGELLQVPARVVDGPGAELKDGPLTLTFDDVSFWYEDDEPAGNHTPLSVRAPQSTVLDQVSFELAPGQVLGLLGRTGSGKTTIARLVFRLYDPQHGAVRLNGYDIRALTQSQVRGHIGLVTQDIQLFHATVRDNLTFFDPSIPDERIVSVLDDLGMRRWLDSLPGGLETRLAPDGGGISAGQAQLLAFARVFLRNPGLVILDEASSRLDPATEQAVERAVERLLQGRTAIIIAHRLPTVQRADQILILERGHMREFGSRAALAADPESHFSHLLRTGMEEALA